MYNRKFTPGKITRLAENEIFVFGSNLEGYHGGGAAWIAMEKFGCGIAGFTDEEIAPLFRDAIDIENVILPKVFVEIIEN